MSCMVYKRLLLLGVTSFTLSNKINSRNSALSDLRRSLYSGLGDNFEDVGLRVHVPDIVPGSSEEGTRRNRQSHWSQQISHADRPIEVDALSFFHVAAIAYSESERVPST